MLLLLTACATQPPPEPKVVVQEVKVPVAVSCVAADTPPAPTYTDTRSALLAAPDFSVRYQLMAANWALRDARLALLEQLLDACAKAAPPVTK